MNLLRPIIGIVVAVVALTALGGLVHHTYHMTANGDTTSYAPAVYKDGVLLKPNTPEWEREKELQTLNGWRCVIKSSGGLRFRNMPIDSPELEKEFPEVTPPISDEDELINTTSYNPN